MKTYQAMMDSRNAAWDQPPHPRTRTIKPICAICGQAFYPGETMVVEYWKTDEERFLHERCTRETKRST